MLQPTFRRCRSQRWLRCLEHRATAFEKGCCNLEEFRLKALFEPSFPCCWVRDVGDQEAIAIESDTLIPKRGIM